MQSPRYPVWPLPDSSADEGRLWLRWLVRLRWVAVAAQVMTVSVVIRVLDGPEVLLAALCIDLVLVGANVGATRMLRSGQPVTPPFLVGQLCLDILALTAFFYLSDGVDNPFTVLYVVHVAMGAVMLRPAGALGLTTFVLFCYASLHLGSRPLHPEHHSLGAANLLNLGQAMAFAITAVSVTGFVMGVASTLRWRSKELLLARDRTAQTDRLRSVGTLAAGAAHEINTPLSTMGLRLRRIYRRYQDEDTRRDVEVIRAQLSRCEEIVQQLLVGAGDPAASQMIRCPAGRLVGEGLHRWSHGNDVAIDLQDDSNGAEVSVPGVAFTQALVNLLENAREAQIEAGRTEAIQVRVSRKGERVIVSVRDHGAGLPAEADRVGDPFFTTKATGTGLGVYVARAVADGSGGGLRYVVRDPGTEAQWWFPAQDGSVA